MAEQDGELQPIIVKKIKKGGGHHGGAWKVAYADFVTAMMAFFLLLWLLNVTTDEQKNAISNYFDPTHPKVSQADSGAGGVLGGLSVAAEGAMVTNVQNITSPLPKGSSVNNRSAQKSPAGEANESMTAEEQALENAKEQLRQEERQRLEDTAQALRDQIEKNPEFADIKDNIIIDTTKEGLRIQVIDREGKPMFASGSARMFEKTQNLLGKISAIIEKQPNHISIRGHTDSTPYGKGANYTNWELSADRANSSRRVLLDSGYPLNKIYDVVGKADTEHLYPKEPTSAGNRRVSITLLKQELTDPDFEKKAKAIAQKTPPPSQGKANPRTPAQEQSTQPALPKIGTFKKTPGEVEFP